MSAAEAWQARARTLRALALLVLARALVALVPLRLWREHLGGRPGTPEDPVRARRLAAQIERAAWRSPVTMRCLPQAMALSWMLRRRAIGHRMVLAVRPASSRLGADDLHAWVECGGRTVLGDLPGPWTKVLELGRE